MNDITSSDSSTFPYIFHQNVSIVPEDVDLPVRVNVYRPKTGTRVPVLINFGPYGKDTPYAVFNARSFAEVNPKQKSEHSAWETPDPAYWTKNGYAVVRGDEAGIGQSPGRIDPFSRHTIQAFHAVVEWAADQHWSSGKVGLLGVSYYGATQWRVAARNPRGLAAICPWEGFTDFYRDFTRHGGILSNTFINTWWDKQIAPNQYGLPGRAASGWCPDTIEGDLSSEELTYNREHLLNGPRATPFRGGDCYATREFDLNDVKVPVLSIANWGGNSLHLRGNIQGFIHAGSELKYLRTIVGRHDLPFYSDESVDLQKSWFDAWLKDDDRIGWTQKGKVPAVTLTLRKGDVGFNNPLAEKLYNTRDEAEWPIARTKYTKSHLAPDRTLNEDKNTKAGEVSYPALGNINDQHFVQFATAPFVEETEITGHAVAHLNVSLTRDINGQAPADIDLFVTLRYIGPDAKEVHCTGTVGDPVPVAKGWLRVTLRQVNTEHPHHREWLPYRDYTSETYSPVMPGEIYPVDVEIWSTNVVAEKGGRVVLEVASGDTQGAGIFLHDDPQDRNPDVFRGTNSIHFGPEFDNYVTLPIIPRKEL
ncbi:alpha/beta-hydrolase [Hortaea werneckii]|nr:alpha/beta-hydrolase [Hortaea werneckii]